MHRGGISGDALRSIRRPVSKVESAGNEQESRASSSQGARPEKQAKRFPPGSGLERFDGFLDQALGLKLGAQRNPDPSGRLEFGGERLRDRDDGMKISEKALAGGTRGQMLASFGRKRAETFGLENELQIFTLHTAHSEESSTCRLPPPTAFAKFVHRPVGVFLPF